MKRTLLSFGTAIAASLIATPAAAQDAAEPMSLPVGTCINMGNSLEPMEESGWGGEPIEQADFQRIKAAGFDTIRLPVRWHNKSAQTAPYTVDPAWMNRVQQVVDWALAADLNVILNSHHFDPIYEDPLGVADWHGGVWRQIAARFADYPQDRLWFELENEPHKNFDHSNLLAALAPALAAVRETNPTRPVIYGGEEWSGINSLATLPLPDDANVYPTFHYYDPFDFTHQGASWTEPNMPPPGRKYGTEEDRTRLAADVKKVEAYVERTGKVPFVGETGAYDKHISTTERAAYHRAVREAFSPTGIGMCMWGYANTFPFYDRANSRWHNELLSAIGLEPSPAATPAAASDPGPHPDLPPALHAFDRLVPGQLANDPTRLDWDTYGDGLRAKGFADETIPGGGAALQLDVRSAGNAWDAGVSVPLVVPVAEGEQVTIGFYARATEGDGELAVRFQRNAPPYPGFGERTIAIGPEWDWYETSAVATQSLGTKDGIVAIQVGAKRQKIEIGQTIVAKGTTSIARR